MKSVSDKWYLVSDLDWVSSSETHQSSRYEGGDRDRTWVGRGVPGQDGAPSYPCSYCGRLFTSKSNLTRHVRDHHSITNPKAALCPVCGKNCFNRSNALTHMYRTHQMTVSQYNVLLNKSINQNFNVSTNYSFNSHDESDNSIDNDSYINCENSS